MDCACADRKSAAVGLPGLRLLGGRGEAAKGSLSQLCSDRGSGGEDGQDSWRVEPGAGQPLAGGS